MNQARVNDVEALLAKVKSKFEAHVRSSQMDKEAAAQAAKAPEKSITILDVRSPEEFSEGHLKGAQNIDIGSPDFQKNFAKLDPAKTYLVHCAAGGRSTRSLGVLGKLGFKSILHLDGGLNAWKAAGLPVEKPAAAPAQ
jgi:rhodanese-related sulfurtransferase